jgi:hypothetical protein
MGFFVARFRSTDAMGKAAWVCRAKIEKKTPEHKSVLLSA